METIIDIGLRTGFRLPAQAGFGDRISTPVDTASSGHDSALVQRTVAGDKAAFSELVDRHQKMIYAIVSRITEDLDDADDVVTDVFAQAYKSIATFKGKSSFSTWLCRIAINRALRFSQRRKSRATASLDDPDTRLIETLASSETQQPVNVLLKKESQDAVRRAVAKLPEKHRVVVVLHYFSGLSCEQTAEILGCSVGTVWSRLHYACSKLRGQLDWIVEQRK